MYDIDFSYTLNKDPNTVYVISIDNVELLSKDQFIKEALKCISNNKHKLSDIHIFDIDSISMYNTIVMSGDSDDRLYIFSINNDINKKLDLIEFINKYYTSIMQEFRYQKEVCTSMIRDGLIVVSKENIC